MASIAEIRRIYPSPIPWSDSDDDEMNGCYCVGGALVMFAELPLDEERFDLAFPAQQHIVMALQKINPDLPDDVALDLAGAIAYANDTGLIEKAWSLAEQGLAYSAEA